MTKKNININADLDDVLDRVFAESARRAIAAPEVYRLTADNSRLLTQYVESALHDLRTRMGGYVTLWSFNPNSETRNVVIQLKLVHPASAGLDDIMRDALVELLAYYALMRFYGDDSTYYGTAWRKYRAQLMLVLARDQAALAQ
ncbi:MAG: hypothetical protein J5565_01940 [Muribaculaceae bacterium]|nr:hypothetical protein [Muribaculaceae bacterium]